MMKRTSAPESAADLLMLAGVVRLCPDCDADQIFMRADDASETPPTDLSASAYCCTACGAAILVDLFDEPAAAAVRGVA